MYCFHPTATSIVVFRLNGDPNFQGESSETIFDPHALKLDSQLGMCYCVTLYLVDVASTRVCTRVALSNRPPQASRAVKFAIFSVGG